MQKATLLDCYQIADLDLTIFGKEEAYSELSIKEYIFMNDMTFIYKIDDKIVGSVIYQKEYCDNDFCSFTILSIGVLPEYQNQGIGKKLMKECFDNIKNFIGDYRFEVTLQVRISNNKAINFYKKFGFVKSRTMPKYYCDGEDGDEMIFRYPQ